MKNFFVMLVGAVLPVFGIAQESVSFQEGLALAIAKGCTECHALGHAEVGPSFRSVAARYRFDAEARNRLPYVIRGGSAGHWGDRFAMWPQQRLSDEEVRQLVDWVLSQ
jgi:cytochrome c